MRKLTAGLRLYWVLASASVRAAMQYRFDFITSTLIQVLMGTYDFLLVAIILSRFHTVAGWTIYELGLLFAVSRTGRGIYRVFCEELEQFERYIVRGEYDSVLTKPLPSLFVLLSRRVDLTRITLVIQGVAIGALSVPPLVRSGQFSPGQIGWLVLASIYYAVLTFVVGLATAAAGFWIVRIEELQVFAQNAPDTAALYPLDLYPAWLKFVLVTVLPFGLGNYVPVVYLLGKGGTWLNLAWPFIGCLVGLTVSLALWHAGEKAYHSTGS